MNYIILLAGLYLLFIGLFMSTKGIPAMLLYKFVPVVLGGLLVVAATMKLAPTLLVLT